MLAQSFLVDQVVSLPRHVVPLRCSLRCRLSRVWFRQRSWRLFVVVVVGSAFPGVQPAPGRTALPTQHARE